MKIEIYIVLISILQNGALGKAFQVCAIKIL
jgi:hypothetical protein